MYDRRYGGRELNFEASGALLQASLVMRDRETDSWWSIMTSSAIGGRLEGADLVELPLGEKTTWGAWRRRHPQTVALSVDGRQHEATDPYADYFASPDTFRNLEIDDRRLEPKAPIYSFRLDGKPWAVAHRAIEGGRLVEADGARLLFFRRRGAPLFESTRAWQVDPALAAEHTPEKLRELAEAGAEGLTRLPGFDTFWYSWVAVNRDTGLLR